VYGGDMFVFGGYVDINGSSNELWKYHIGEEKVVLLEIFMNIICVQLDDNANANPMIKVKIKEETSHQVERRI